MKVFLENGDILDGQCPSLTGMGVVGVFLTKEDFSVKGLEFLKTCVVTRMVDIDQKTIWEKILNSLGAYLDKRKGK